MKLATMRDDHGKPRPRCRCGPTASSWARLGRRGGEGVSWGSLLSGCARLGMSPSKDFFTLWNISDTERIVGAVTLSRRSEISQAVGLELRRLIAGCGAVQTMAMSESLAMTHGRQVLHLLQLEGGPVTAVGRLGELAHCRPVPPTRVIDRLEAVVVHRVRDTADRRRVLIHPDRQKARELEARYDEQTAAFRGALIGLSTADLEGAHRFLSRLNQTGSPGTDR